MKGKTVRKVIIVVAFIFSGFLMTDSVNAVRKDPSLGTSAYKHTEYLTENIGSRVAGTENEQKAGAYIYQQLEKLGFETTEQKFSYIRSGRTIHSANIIGKKYSKSSKNNNQIIIGAHYDSVSVGKGADDNGSSVGVILETAETIAKRNIHYDITFVFFGAEEQGLRGSSYYVSQMTQEERNNTIAMINLDSLLAGDNIYVYGSRGENGGIIRDLALQIAEKRGIPLETNPGINPDYPKGTTGDWSDHAPFQRAGIPIGYFEATNWEIGELDGYTQTVKHGGIWHTKNDNLEFLEKEFPGRVQAHLTQFTLVLTEVLLNLKHEIDK